MLNFKLKIDPKTHILKSNLGNLEEISQKPVAILSKLSS